MSDELLDLARSVVERAVPGEGLEVYVTRGTETEVASYEGEVESLTSADSSGVGIRVVVGDAEVPAGVPVTLTVFPPDPPRTSRLATLTVEA